MQPPSGEPVALTDQELAAWGGLLRTHARLVRELDAELTLEHRLPLSSYEVLLRLANSETGGMRMSEIADAVLLSRSGLTRLVDRLEREGLVAREPCNDDARGQRAVITELGRARFSEARVTHLAGVRRSFLGRLDARELSQLSRIWRVLERA